MNTDTTAKSTQISIFYDGSCPLCKREIAHYQHLDHDSKVCWIDISERPPQLQQYGLDYDTAMSRLHVVDDQATMQTGAKAFLTLWDTLPYYRWLARIIRMTRTAPLLEWLYVRFARWRLRNANKRNAITDKPTGHTNLDTRNDKSR